ncbi:MAG: oligoendopeptidase F [Clostridia bacterium]|nr:oligoendopeptidase F [Clostridia bacterium]
MPLSREQVNASRKWNLNSLFETEEELEKVYAEVKKEIPAFARFHKKLTPDNAHVCLAELSGVTRRIERLYIYAALRRDENTTDPKYQALNSRMEMLLVELNSATSFIIPQISKFAEKDLSAMSERPEYADYTTLLDAVIREKKHILSGKEEKLLSEISSFSSGFKDVFSNLDNADLTFEPFTDPEGNRIELSHGMYSFLLQNPDGKIRKQAFENYYQSYIAHKNTIAAAYAGSVKKDCALAKVRKYKNALDKALQSETIDPKVYHNLIKAVRKATPALHDYVALRKKALGFKKMHMYDMYVPLTQEYKLSMDYDDAYQLVIEALAPLGDKYKEILTEAYGGGWIDVEETQNKRSGAYSWGAYDGHPYVLLNYQRTAHDVFTIAHEMGHAIHSYKSNRAQCYSKASYEIFVAEIASTVNEVLLLKHLIQTAEGEQRKFLLTYYLDMFRTTLFRQTMFAEFEKFTHAQIEAGIPLTSESMSEQYLKLNKKYYGKAVTHDEQIAHEWSRIPHFYNAFYVYKYATGIISAINIVSKLLKDATFVEKYFRFLSAGGSMRPLDILALAEVDLTTEQPFEVAMAEFRNTLEELKKII